MSIAPSIVRGVIRGKLIELDRVTGLPEGQQVTVTVQAELAPTLASGEGLRRAFGAWAGEAEELDKYLEWNRQQRKRARRELDP